MRLAWLSPLLLVAAAPLAAAEPAPLPGWLAGAWTGEAGDTWLDEYWTPPRGGTMFGAARVGSGEELAFWEVTRIERKPDGSISYIASPRGAPGSEFPLVAQGPAMVEFANPAHDYPQRIRYWREGDRLLAEISLLDGTRPERFEYRLAK